MLLLPLNTPTVTLSMLQITLYLCLAAVFWYFCERPFQNRRVTALMPTPGRVSIVGGLADK
jgi:peptidoglycan/LPS O-acetylase OafA/YrhL